MDEPQNGFPVMTTAYLVKGEDLNHHHTLYAGRCVEWCVQMAYITAQACFAEHRALVFMSIRSLSVRAPAQLGDVVQFSGRIDYIGESTIGVRIDAQKLQPRDDQRMVATGTFLFCTVDEQGRSCPHLLQPLCSSKESSSRWKRMESDLLPGGVGSLPDAGDASTWVAPTSNR